MRNRTEKGKLMKVDGVSKWLEHRERMDVGRMTMSAYEQIERKER